MHNTRWRSQSEKVTYYISTMWHSGKGKTMETVKRSVVVIGWSSRGMNRQSTEFYGSENIWSNNSRCYCLDSKLCSALFCKLMDCSQPGSLSMGFFSKQVHSSGLPFPSPRDIRSKDRTHISCIGWRILLPLGHLGSPKGRYFLLYSCQNP